MSRTSGYTYSVLFSYQTIEVLAVLFEVTFTSLVRNEPVSPIAHKHMFPSKPSKHQGGGGHVLRLEERSYETFQIVSFSGNELFVHDVYAKEKLRTFFFLRNVRSYVRAWFMFLVCGKYSRKH